MTFFFLLKFNKNTLSLCVILLCHSVGNVYLERKIMAKYTTLMSGTVFVQPLKLLTQNDEITTIITLYLGWLISYYCRSQWPRGLRRRSAAARLLRSWFRIPPGAWISVCCECCVLSGRGLCDELITRPEESYWLWCVVVCGLENSRMRRPWPALGRSATAKKKLLIIEGDLWHTTPCGTARKIAGLDSQQQAFRTINRSVSFVCPVGNDMLDF